MAIRLRSRQQDQTMGVGRLTSLFQEAFLSGFVHLFLDFFHVQQNLRVRQKHKQIIHSDRHHINSGTIDTIDRERRTPRRYTHDDCPLAAWVLPLSPSPTHLGGTLFALLLVQTVPGRLGQLRLQGVVFQVQPLEVLERQNKGWIKKLLRGIPWVSPSPHSSRGTRAMVL